MKIKPLFDRVLIEPVVTKSSAGGIAIPISAEDKPNYGTVISIGTGTDVEGKQTKFQVEVGDKVLYSKFGGVKITIDSKEYIIIKQNDILATYKGE